VTKYFKLRKAASIEIIATMVNYARRNGLLEGARAAQADDKAAEQVKQDAAMLERRKEKLGPEMFDLLTRLRADEPNFSGLGNYWKMDIDALLAKVRQ
jgi:hypothetical protein